MHGTNVFLGRPNFPVGWIVNEVNNGAVLPGLYPMNAETKARYAATKK